MAFAKGNKHGRKFPAGQSGNPGGLPQARRAFEDAFYEALISLGSPTEAAGLLWDAARKHEPWAVTLLLSRLAPETPGVRLAADPADALDFSAFTDQELEWFGRIVERIKQPAVAGLIAAPADEKEPFK
jgi:hypothetical protein